jgi:hypothetical protein
MEYAETLYSFVGLLTLITSALHCFLKYVIKTHVEAAAVAVVAS